MRTTIARGLINLYSIVRGILRRCYAFFFDAPSPVYDLPGASDDPVKTKKTKGVAPRKRDATRPSYGKSYLERFELGSAEKHHPIIEKLRRRAVNDIFDWLGLPLIPGQIWPVLTKVGDPGVAVEKLIAALGCDSLRVRQRDPDALKRFDASITVVIALDTLRPHISQTHAQEIEYLIFSGKYEDVKRYGEVVSGLSSIVIGKQKAQTLKEFKSYVVYFDDVKVYLDDIAAISPDDVQEALRLSDDFLKCMERYAVINEQIETAIGALRANWPKDMEFGLEADLRDGMFLLAGELHDALIGDSRLSLENIYDMLDECQFLLDDIQDQYRRVCGAPGGHAASGTSDVDEALVFFGFSPGSEPTWDEVNRAWKEKMRKVHPDIAADGADAAKHANMHRDTLRRYVYAAA